MHYFRNHFCKSSFGLTWGGDIPTQTWPLTGGFFYRIWSVGAINSCGEDPAGFLRLAWLLCLHTLLQPLFGKSDNLAHKHPFKWNCSPSSGEERRPSWGKQTIETIYLSTVAHPLCGSHAGCMCSCFSVLSHGRMDLPRIPLFLFCGIQHRWIWRLGERAESAAWGNPGLPGGKQSPDAPGCVLHVFALQLHLCDHKTSPELVAGDSGGSSDHCLNSVSLSQTHVTVMTKALIRSRQLLSTVLTMT